jgi:hypothetical protein
MGKSEASAVPTSLCERYSTWMCVRACVRVCACVCVFGHACLEDGGRDTRFFSQLYEISDLSSRVGEMSAAVSSW